ncbi:right-handed parallel beta-helix repeat-containing protein [Dactylosporangium sp. NPDC049140]|uniref:NosD domain-containing protein n=1 Tax=Dactylosporangium sp. NPDC049140 TaxID=3155647 RepID=UPI0033C2BBFE
MATGAALVAGAGPANAETANPLYVNNDPAANCSDAGTGTKAQPYCTIAPAVAAVTAGQTIYIAGGFDEHVTIAKSGNPGQPITLKDLGDAGQPRARLQGAGAGFTIDGQHDIVIDNVWVLSGTSGPGFDVSRSSRIAVQNTRVQPGAGAVPGVHLAAVTDSTLTGVVVIGSQLTAGISLDAATSGVVVTSAHVTGTGGTAGTSDRGIEILGSHDTVLNSTVSGLTTGVFVGPGATGNTVANTSISSGKGSGIDNAGASGTAITNDSVQDNCGPGIRVSGASSGVSVQNNIVAANGAAVSHSCSAAAGPEIGVYDGAVGATVVDYNGVNHKSSPDTYAWGTATYFAPADFRAASGQAAHDAMGAPVDISEDSANSAAPGYQATDAGGRPREDDPARPNTGAGPITYADRGNTERIKAPSAQVTVKSTDQNALSVTVDASGSTPGWAPLGSTAYQFEFNDGTPTVKQASPIATHKYAQPGVHSGYVTVVDANGISSSGATWTTSLWPTVRTVTLLADNGTYVSAGADGNQPLRVGSTTIGPGEQFEFVQSGSQIALRSKVNGRYVANNAGDTTLKAQAETTMLDYDSPAYQLQSFDDGTVAFLSAYYLNNNSYVSSNSGTTKVLTVDRSVAGPWEKFRMVDVGNTAVTLHAHANGKYVTADLNVSGTLIANRGVVGAWENFDLVDAGNGSVALFSHANGKYVTAENGGNSALIANRTAVGPWEKFTVVKNADGSIALVAGVNGKYVTADLNNSGTLIANRTAIGAWESFDRP